MNPNLPDCFLQTPLAHRGFHDVSNGRPENSRAAIIAAIKAGYGIEIDIQPSADMIPMVFHDYDLKRLTGETGPVALKSHQALQQIPLIGGDETVPDLVEILSIIDGRVPLLIEIKDQDGQMGENVGPLEKAVAQVVGSYEGPLAVMSFNPHSVFQMKTYLPEIARGITTSAYRAHEWPLSTATCDHLRQIPDFDRVGASFISHEINDLHNNKRVSQLKENGAGILCWTVTSPEEETSARQVAQNITFEQYPAAL